MPTEIKQDKRATSPSPNQMRLGAEVSERVEIEDVTLLSASFHRAPEATQGAKQVQTSAQIQTKLHKESSRLSVKVRFMLTAMSAQQASEPPREDVKLDVVFLLVYRLNSVDGLEDKHIEAFANLNGLFNAWPYIREFVQSVTARMGFPPLILNSLKLFGKNEIPRKPENLPAKKA